MGRNVKGVARRVLGSGVDGGKSVSALRRGGDQAESHGVAGAVECPFVTRGPGEESAAVLRGSPPESSQRRALSCGLVHRLRLHSRLGLGLVIVCGIDRSVS